MTKGHRGFRYSILKTPHSYRNIPLSVISALPDRLKTSKTKVCYYFSLGVIILPFLTSFNFNRFEQVAISSSKCICYNKNYCSEVWWECFIVANPELIEFWNLIRSLFYIQLQALVYILLIIISATKLVFCCWTSTHELGTLCWCYHVLNYGFVVS